MKYLRNVTTLGLDANACIGCGMCVTVCPHGVLTMRDQRAVIADRDACIECGACARNCPEDALSVDAGVGCATGLLFGVLGVGSGECCCETDCCAGR